MRISKYFVCDFGYHLINLAFVREKTLPKENFTAKRGQGISGSLNYTENKHSVLRLAPRLLLLSTSG